MTTPVVVPGTRRNTELLLLGFAVFVVVGAEAAVEGTWYGHFSTHLLTYAAVPLAAGLVTHLVIRRVAPYADPLLLPVVVLLNGLGLVMIHRLDDGRTQATALNFADRDAIGRVTSEHLPAAAAVVDPITGEVVAEVDEEHGWLVALRPYEGRSLLVTDDACGPTR